MLTFTAPVPHLSVPRIDDPDPNPRDCWRDAMERLRAAGEDLSILCDRDGIWRRGDAPDLHALADELDALIRRVVAEAGPHPEQRYNDLIRGRLG